MSEMDFEFFKSLNSSGRKVSWHKRFAYISKNYTSIDRLNWKKVFVEDPEILGSIVNDILKLNVPSRGRPGKRPSLQEDQAREMFSTLMGENFTLEPFDIAFRRLVGDTSIRKVAASLGLDKMLIHRLLHGKQKPSLDHIEKVAAHYHKDPSYFVEWRSACILTYMHDLLEANPESTVKMFDRLRKKSGV